MVNTAIDNEMEFCYNRTVVHYNRDDKKGFMMPKIVFLTGPVGVGKTTLIREALLQCPEFSYVVGNHQNNADLPPYTIIELSLSRFVELMESLHALRDEYRTVLVIPPDGGLPQDILHDRIKQRDRHLFVHARTDHDTTKDMIDHDCRLLPILESTHDFDMMCGGVYLRLIVKELVQFLNSVAQVTKEAVDV